jgi:hypothetical protein
MRSLICVAILSSLVLASDGPQKETPEPNAKLWAGLSVTSPTIGADDVQDGQFFMVSFALVNDGDKAVDPEIDSSQFLVNGKELKDWGFIIRNGPRGKDFESLPAGQIVRFGKGMGRYFTEPGVYKLQWKGKAFESAVVEFRVFPGPTRHQAPELFVPR